MTVAPEKRAAAPVSEADIPLSAPDLRGREAEYLARCIADNWVSSAGPFVGEIEARVAALAGTAHAVATCNGTAALHLALLAVGVGPGDRVILPDWTFVATANAVRHAGAEPIFVDVTEETWTLDPALVAELLCQPDHGVTAVIAVDALGHPADMDELLEICDQADVRLIEDAAGAIGARYKDRPAGGLGEIGVFSFNGNKTVTAGGGGMMVTDRADWAEAARHLSTQARSSADYTHDRIGFNYRMTNVNAAVGLAQIERLDEMIAAKRAIAARYDAVLADRNDLRPMPRAAWAAHNCWLYSLRCADAAAAESLIAHLRAQGIGARRFWQSLAAQPPYREAASLIGGVSPRLAREVISLPSSSGLRETQIERVAVAVETWKRP